MYLSLMHLKRLVDFSVDQLYLLGQSGNCSFVSQMVTCTVSSILFLNACLLQGQTKPFTNGLELETPTECVFLQKLSIFRMPSGEVFEFSSLSHFLETNMVLLIKCKYIPASVCTMTFRTPPGKRFIRQLSELYEWRSKSLLNVHNARSYAFLREKNT